MSERITEAGGVVRAAVAELVRRGGSDSYVAAIVETGYEDAGKASARCAITHEPDTHEPDLHAVT